MNRKEQSGWRVVMSMVCAISLVAAIAFAATATAQSGERQAIVAAFAQQQPGVATAAHLAIDYVNPSDPSAKPPAVATVVETLPFGTRIDTSVPALCTVSDAQLMAEGAGACPGASQVGTGSITVDTGLPAQRLIMFNVTALNNTGEMVLLLQGTDNPNERFVVHEQIQGDTVTTQSAPIPGGPPDGYTAVKTVRLNFRQISTGQGAQAKNYITTPQTCGTSHLWTTAIAFTYRDGTTETATSSSPCAAAAANTGSGAHTAPSGAVRHHGARLHHRSHRAGRRHRNHHRRHGRTRVRRVHFAG